MNNQILQDNLFKALGLFIEAMRSYIVALLSKQDKNNWQDLYYNTLTPQQKNHWDNGINGGSQPENLIDFHNLKGFALGCKYYLKEDFQNKVNNFPCLLFSIKLDFPGKCRR